MVVHLAEEVPDGRSLGHHVGLVTAVRDHVVGTLIGPQMLAAEIPAHVHELDGVQGAPPPPRRSGAMRRLTDERELRRHETGAAGRPPR